MLLIYVIVRYLSKNKFKYNEVRVSNILLLETVKNLYSESLSYINKLNSESFIGSRTALVKLKTYEYSIFTDIDGKLQSNRRYSIYTMTQISKKLNQIASDIGDMMNTLSDNRSLYIDIKNNLETSLSQVKNKILNSIDNAKDMIVKINKDNPISVWRNINIDNIDRQIEYQIDKSDQEYRFAIKSIESGDFISARLYAESSMTYMTNAFTIIQNIFDVNNMIDDSKKMYNKYILELPKIISNAEKICIEKNTETNINMLNEIKSNYYYMQQIINNTSEKIDWTLIWPIINIILSKSDSIIFNKQS